MGKKTRPTFKKRQKELARQQKQQNKQAQRRAKSELNKDGKAPRAEGEDPDIGGIRPGPQPLPDEWRSLPEPDDSDDTSGNDR
jgi:hypothetical protein